MFCVIKNILIDRLFLQTAPSSVMLIRRRVRPTTELDPILNTNSILNSHFGEKISFNLVRASLRGAQTQNTIVWDNNFSKTWHDVQKVN